jgi:hypothetical protein
MEINTVIKNQLDTWLFTKRWSQSWNQTPFFFFFLFRGIASLTLSNTSFSSIFLPCDPCQFLSIHSPILLITMTFFPFFHYAGSPFFFIYLNPLYPSLIGDSTISVLSHHYFLLASPSCQPILSLNHRPSRTIFTPSTGATKKQLEDVSPPSSMSAKLQPCDLDHRRCQWPASSIAPSHSLPWTSW